jgi:hypothetical protein
MSVSSDGRQPDEGYLADWDGVAYDWAPGKGWIPTNLTVTHEALRIIRITRKPVATGTSGQLLYRDPTRVYVPDLRPPTVPKVNGLATTARVFSWLGLVALPFGIIGLILGYMALGRIASDDVKSRSVAKTAIIVGWVFTALTVVVALLVVSHS